MPCAPRIRLVAFLLLVPFFPSLILADAPQGKNVVLWISVDGNRGDYIDRGQSPFLKSLMEHGEYTKQLTPIFPSLTFPSHTSEATGVPAGTHGIVSNKFFDMSIGKEFNMPSDPNLLQAEPIWITAARQGVRSGVFDWPLSDGENKLPSGAPHATIFNDAFDTELTDQQRLEKMVDAYRKDFDNIENKQPLQLLMGYCFAIDHAGHGSGPESEETTKAIHDTDAVLQKTVGEVADIFNTRMHPDQGDKLYVLITTDHGMESIKKLVNLKHLMGRVDVPDPDPVHSDWAGSLANVYLSDVPGPQREGVKKSILENLRKADYLKCWTRDELPGNFGYGNPSRTGDIVVSLDPGYYFTSRDIDAPETVENDPKSLKGMHGYDPNIDDKMQGFMVLTRWSSQGASHDLGKIDTLRIHPTVAKLLGIKPAPGATEQPLNPLP